MTDLLQLNDDEIDHLLAQLESDLITPEQCAEITRLNYNLGYQIGFTPEALRERILSVCGATVPDLCGVDFPDYTYLTENQADLLIASLNATEDRHNNESLAAAVADRKSHTGSSFGRIA